MNSLGKAPWMEIESSRFDDDWHKCLQDPKFCDVTFVAEGDQRIEAHKIVLCCASTFFCKVLWNGQSTVSVMFIGKSFNGSCNKILSKASALRNALRFKSIS